MASLQVIATFGKLKRGRLRESMIVFAACLCDYALLVSAVLNCVTKVIRDCVGFALLRYVIGPENSRHIFNQSDKTKTNHGLVTCVFPCFKQFTCLYFESSLAPRDIFFPLIECCGCFGFEFLTFSQKVPYCSNPIKPSFWKGKKRCGAKLTYFSLSGCSTVRCK